MELEIKVEETESGFRFKDSVVEIEVVKGENHYIILWTNKGEETTTHPLPNATTPKQAYSEFRESISGYWSHSLGLFFEMTNKEKIDELFKPLAKYQ